MFGRAGLALTFGVVLASAATAGDAPQITAAHFSNPTGIYDHGILGDAVEFLDLEVQLSTGAVTVISLAGQTHVFEDLAPRLWDVTGDGFPEVVVVETDMSSGAQLAIYGLRNGAVAKIAETPHIGSTHRWLAPIAAADLDRDGHIEVAYIDRPHLARTLRVWSYVDGAFAQVAAGSSLTNHRIGQDFITGGLRDCGRAPELITVDADWSRIIATTFDGQGLRARVVGPFDGPASISDALSC